MGTQTTLILDVMGADLGINEMLRGAAEFCERYSDASPKIVLVSTDPDKTKQLLDSEHKGSRLLSLKPEIAEAKDELPEKVVSPVDIYRKHPESSIRIAMNLAKETEHSAVISPGNTGLVMTSALYTLGRVKGISRPPILTPMPTKGKQLLFLDGGSNVDCKPQHLYHFAVLAHLYKKHIEGVQHPSIALISNGIEDYKGDTLVREAAALIAEDKNLNFTGFVEGHTLFEGELDIMVCDGFIGNIILKLAEGVADAILSMLRNEIEGDVMAAIAAKTMMRGAFGRLRSRLDYTNFGGAPLLGLKGNVIICHGRSPAGAIRSAMKVGHEIASSQIATKVAQYVEDHYSLMSRSEATGSTESSSGG